MPLNLKAINKLCAVVALTMFLATAQVVHAGFLDVLGSFVSSVENAQSQLAAAITSTVTGTTVASTVETPIATLRIKSGPKLAMFYDSANKESSLAATAEFTITTRNNVLLHSSSPFPFVTVDSIAGHDASYLSTNTYSIVISGAQKDVNGFYQLIAGKVYTARARTSYKPSSMMAGQYSSSLNTILFYSTDQTAKLPVWFDTNKSNSVTVIGEPNPTITSITSPVGTLDEVTIGGTKFSSHMTVTVNAYDTQTGQNTFSKTFPATAVGNKITFKPSDIGAGPGFYNIFVTNLDLAGDEAKSINASYFEVQKIASIPTVQVTPATFKIVYDSNQKESSLSSIFRVTVIANKGDVRIGSGAFTVVAIQPKSGTQAYAQGTDVLGSSQEKLTFPVNIPAGTSKSFYLVSTFNPKIMFAGTYQASVLGVLIDSTATQDPIYLPITSNTTNSLTIVGETSPYISTVTSPIKVGGKMAIEGQRLNGVSDFGKVYIDNIPVSGVDGAKDASVLFFVLPILTNGQHNVYVKTEEGLSNTVYFNVTTEGCYVFAKYLTVGSTGADVVALQNLLVDKGFLTIPAGATRGYFGNETKDAVIKYQLSVGISPADGYVGPVTIAKLNYQCNQVNPDDLNCPIGYTCVPTTPLVLDHVDSQGHLTTSDGTFYEPRLNFGNSSADKLPSADDVTATKWCQAVPNRGYTSGTSHTSSANPQDGMRFQWNGSAWQLHGGGDYARYFKCASGGTTTQVPTVTTDTALYVASTSATLNGLITNVGTVVSAPTDAKAVPVDGGGYSEASSEAGHVYRIYSYVNIKGGQVFSKNYATASHEGFTAGGPWHDEVSWSAVNGVDGYRVYIHDSYNNRSFNYYQDVVGTSFNDNNDKWIAGGAPPVSVSGSGFDYGLTTAYGAKTPIMIADGLTLGAYTREVMNLSCGTTYHFRAFASNVFGIGYGADQTFTTSPCISGGVIVSNGNTTVTLNDNGTAQPNSATAVFAFKIDNLSPTSDIYVSKTASAIMMTVPVGTLVSTPLSQATPNTIAGDTPTSYIITAGKSRDFVYTSTITNASGASGTKTVSIVSVMYGTDSMNTSVKQISNDLSKLVASPFLYTSSAPSIRTVSPNGGETYFLGSTIPVTWSANYNSNSVRVRLYSPVLNDVYVSPLLNSTVGGNSFTIPFNAADTAGQYKVNVCDDNQSPVGLPGKSLCDISDNYFNINGTNQKSILTVNVTGAVSGTNLYCNGIPCSYQGTYLSSDKVTVVASPAVGYSLSGYSGACTGTGACVISMDSSKTLNVAFTKNDTSASKTLTVNATGAAYGDNLYCNGTPCEYKGLYSPNTVVEVKAVPRTGYTYLYSGACAGSTTCSIPMNSDQTLNVQFKQKAVIIEI